MAMKNFGQFSCRGCSWIITINYTILEVCGARIFLSIFIQTCAFTVLLLVPKSYKFSGYPKQIIILGFRVRVEGGNGMELNGKKGIFLKYSSLLLFGSFNRGNGKSISLFGSLSKREWNG